jgi:hypothetical protein
MRAVRRATKPIPAENHRHRDEPLMVLALIAIAVGYELAIAHPGDDDDATLASRSSRSARRRCSSARSFFPYEALARVPQSRSL